MAKCRGKKKKLNNRGAYSEITDENRLETSAAIDKAMQDPSFPADTGLFLTKDYESLVTYGPVAAAEKLFFAKEERMAPPEHGLY